MSAEIAEIIETVLYGEGALIGLMFILSLGLLVSWKVKYSGTLFAIILIFLSIEYLNRISNSTLHAWYFLIALIGVVFHIGLLYRDVT